MFLPFLFRKALRCRRSAELLGRHEVLIPALHSEHVADHFPGYRQRGPVGGCLSPVLCHKSRRVHGTPASPVWLLQSALAGRACSAAWRSACALSYRPTYSLLTKPAVADGLLDRNETCDASDLQSPRHYRDRPHSRHSPRSLLSRLARTHAPVE